MKTARLFLVALPLLFLAATSNHQAFGPMRFGMPTEAARAAQNHITQSFQSHRRDTLTAADVRAQFVSNGSLRVAKNASVEGVIPVYFSYKAEPIVTQVSIGSKSDRPEGYPSTVRQAWEVLQDIGDCKFQRKEAKGQFPPIEVLTMDNPNAAKSGWAEIVTDTWELEGVRIELLVRMSPPQAEGSGATPRNFALYNAILRATEIAPPK